MRYCGACNASPHQVFRNSTTNTNITRKEVKKDCKSNTGMNIGTIWFSFLASSPHVIFVTYAILLIKKEGSFGKACSRRIKAKISCRLSTPSGQRLYMPLSISIVKRLPLFPLLLELAKVSKQKLNKTDNSERSSCKQNATPR